EMYRKRLRLDGSTTRQRSSTEHHFKVGSNLSCYFRFPLLYLSQILATTAKQTAAEHTATRNRPTYKTNLNIELGRSYNCTCGSSPAPTSSNPEVGPNPRWAGSRTK